MVRVEERKSERSGGDAEEPKPAADSPVGIEIAADKKEYPFRGAIRLTVTYTDTSKEKVELSASGIAPGEGFEGETCTVASGGRDTSYSTHGIHPGERSVTLEAGKSRKREVELAALLSNTGDAASDRKTLPDPFGRLGEYAVRPMWRSAVNVEAKPAFRGPAECDTVKFSVRR